MQSCLPISSSTFGNSFPLPNSINAITVLVGQVLTEIESRRERGEIGAVYLFHNRQKSGAIYEPVSQRLLPLMRLCSG